MKKLNIAMLSDQAQFVGSPEEANITGGVVQLPNVNDGFDELGIAMQDLEHIDQVIGEAVDASGELIDEQQAIDQVKQEGATQAAMEALQRNVNSLLKQVGMEQGTNFAANAYANKYHNRVALEAGLEDIKAFLVRIWDAIMSAIRKTVNIVKDILKKFFDLSLKIKSSCESIKKTAEGLKGKTHRSVEKVGSFTLAKYARFDNKPLEPADVLKNFDTWTAHNYTFIESISGVKALDEYKVYIKKTAELFSTIKPGAEIDQNNLKRETDAMGDLMVKRIVDNFDFHRNGVHTTKPFIGDIHYEFSDKTLAFQIVQEDEFKAIPSEETHTPFTVEQTISMCDKIIDHMEAYENVNKYFDNLDALQSSIGGIAKDAISGKTELDYVQRKLISTSTSFTIKIFIDAIRKVGVGAREYDLQMSKALAHWCALSMSTL